MSPIAHVPPHALPLAGGRTVIAIPATVAGLIAAARTEATTRLALADSRRTVPTVTEMRTVLWETQATPAYHRIGRPTQLAVEVALVRLNPVRARFASIRPGAWDGER